MKIIVELIRYILVALLTLMIIVLYMCHLISSTVLSKDYIVLKLEETNYFGKIYADFNYNVEKYILQSGLDDVKFSEICNKDKIRADTILILENVYYGKGYEIETETIKTNLNKIIDEYLEGKEITIESRESIEQFEDLICKEYINTIMHTNYENNLYQKIIIIQNYVTKFNRYAKFGLFVVVLLIIITNLKCKNRIYSLCGMSIMLFGIIIIYGSYKIKQNISIDNIYLLGDAFSDFLKRVVNENIDNSVFKAKLNIVFGLLLDILGNILIVKSRKRKRKKKILYLTDGSR